MLWSALKGMYLICFVFFENDFLDILKVFPYWTWVTFCFSYFSKHYALRCEISINCNTYKVMNRLRSLGQVSDTHNVLTWHVSESDSENDNDVYILIEWVLITKHTRMVRLAYFCWSPKLYILRGQTKKYISIIKNSTTKMCELSTPPLLFRKSI